MDTLARFKCYHCDYDINDYTSIINHCTNAHPDEDIKYIRRREIRYRTKCLIGYQPGKLMAEGKVLQVLDEKHETLTVNQTVVSEFTPKQVSRSTSKPCHTLKKRLVLHVIPEKLQDERSCR